VVPTIDRRVLTENCSDEQITKGGRMFSSLMPQRREFFELLAAHSEQVAAGANATLRLINGLGDGSGNAAALVAEVNLTRAKCR
jgi:hypothetical protein